MKYILYTIAIMLCAGCSSKKHIAHAEAFGTVAGAEFKNDQNDVVQLELPLADGEIYKFSVGTKYENGTASGRGSSEIAVMREGSELKLIGNGSGGEGVVWKNKVGEILICTAKEPGVTPPRIFTFRIGIAEEE